MRTKFDFIYISRTFLNHKNLKTIHALQESILSENGPVKLIVLYNDKILSIQYLFFPRKIFKNFEQKLSYKI